MNEVFDYTDWPKCNRRPMRDEEMCEPTEQDQIECSNYFESVDWNALREAEAILKGEIEATPMTRELVAKWYGDLV